MNRDHLLARAASTAVICERQRVADLVSLRAEAEQERKAHAERIARLLDEGGYTEAAAYVRAHGARRVEDQVQGIRRYSDD